MEPLLSPRQVADVLGVSESSVKRWVDGGELQAVRTAGGHRRIARSEAVRFARASGTFPARPDLLSLPGPVPSGDTPASGDPLVAAFHHALLEDDRATAVALLSSAFLSGEPVAALCDGPIRIALERIGELWKHDSRGILHEHRATDICVYGLGLLRSLLPTAGAGAPAAVGSAGEKDPYLLPGMCCAVALADIGFRDIDLGPRTPVSTKLAAVERYAPVLVWHTASIGGEEIAELVSAVASAAKWSGRRPPRIVVGGRALASKPPPRGTEPLTSMKELQAFAKALLPEAGARVEAAGSAAN